MMALWESSRLCISAASSGRGGRPKKADANNGDENDAQHTHDGWRQNTTTDENRSIWRVIVVKLFD
jgi:hypothetical protein